MVLKTLCSDFYDQPSQSGWVITTDPSKGDRHINCRDLLDLNGGKKGEKKHDNKDKKKDKCHCHGKNRPNKPNRRDVDIVIGASNPTSTVSVPDVATNTTVNTPVTIRGWTLNTADVTRSFNTSTGIFTAPSAGDYQADLVLSYVINERVVRGLTGPAAAGNIPYLELYDVNNNARITAVSFRTFSRIGQLTLNRIVKLKAGQKIAFRFVPNGIVIGPDTNTTATVVAFDAPLHNTTLSIIKVRDSNNNNNN